MIKRSLLLILYFLILSGRSYAQKTDLGILLGGSYYYGDIVNPAFIQYQSIHAAGGIFIRQHLNNRLCIRVNIMYCKLGSADSILKDNAENSFQRSRNLAFYTNIWEVSGVVEYNLVPDVNTNKKMGKQLIPYLYGGLGLFYFEPKAINPLSGEKVNLRPLKLNGSSYSPIAFSMPLGVGLRYYLNANWQLGLDLGVRLTSTSYIDDIDGGSFYQTPASLPSDEARLMMDRSVDGRYSAGGSKRGKLDYINDIYCIGGVTLTYRLWPQGLSGSSRGGSVHCPRFY